MKRHCAYIEPQSSTFSTHSKSQQNTSDATPHVWDQGSWCPHHTTFWYHNNLNLISKGNRVQGTKKQLVLVWKLAEKEILKEIQHFCWKASQNAGAFSSSGLKSSKSCGLLKYLSCGPVSHQQDLEIEICRKTQTGCIRTKCDAVQWVKIHTHATWVRAENKTTTQNCRDVAGACRSRLRS